MEDAERIRRFTRGVATMKDPPMLPIALWFGTVPALTVLGLAPPVAVLISLVVAVVATALASRWFTRTYGVVTPSADSFPGRGRASWGFALIVFVLALEVLSDVTGLPVRLGMVGFGAALFWGARASQGLRPHLYVLGTVCVLVAFVPFFIDQARRDSSLLGGTMVLTAFGLGWVYVCIQDYRMLVRSLANVRR